MLAVAVLLLEVVRRVAEPTAVVAVSVGPVCVEEQCNTDGTLAGVAVVLKKIGQFFLCVWVCDDVLYPVQFASGTELLCPLCRAGDADFLHICLLFLIASHHSHLHNTQRRTSLDTHTYTYRQTQGHRRCTGCSSAHYQHHRQKVPLEEPSRSPLLVTQQDVR